MKKVIVVVIIIVFAILLLIGFMRVYFEKANAKPTIGDSSIPVQAELAREETMRKVLEYVGNVKAEEEAFVFPKTSGKVLEKIKEEGDPVNKGDVLMYIDRDEVGLKFEKAPIESPIAGIVGQIMVDIGDQVTPQAAIGLVVKMDQARIDLDIPEIYASKVSLGQPVNLRLDAYAQDVFAGKITKISPVLNLANRAFPVEILVPNLDHKLMSGMFVRVEVVIESHENAISVRKEAVLGKEPNAYVYVIKDNIAKLRNVALGIRSADRIEILSGITKDENVVILGQQRLFDGALVKIDRGSSQEEKE